MKISDNTNISLPVRNLLALCAAVAIGIFAYTEITARITSLETSRELHQADLLKKSEQLPTDQEQFMLLEYQDGQIVKIQKRMEDMQYNAVNIKRLQEDMKEARENIEKLKDKIRETNGGH